MKKVDVARWWKGLTREQRLKVRKITNKLLDGFRSQSGIPATLTVGETVLRSFARYGMMSMSGMRPTGPGVDGVRVLFTAPTRQAVIDRAEAYAVRLGWHIDNDPLALPEPTAHVHDEGPRFVRKRDCRGRHPLVYAWTVALARRGDMVECDSKGRRVKR